MRPEAEIRAVIEDLNFTLALPGDAGLDEKIMAINRDILKWVLGEDGHTAYAFASLKQAVLDGKRYLESVDAARDRRN